MAKLMATKEDCDQFLKDWDVVVYSHTVAKYNENYAVFEAKYTLDADPEEDTESPSEYSDEEEADAAEQAKDDLKWRRRNYKKALRYVFKTWLTPWRKKIIKCYTNRYLHLDTTVSSRGEGAHRQIKAQLASSAGDLFLVFESIELLLKNVLADWEGKLAKAKNTVPHQLRIGLFRELIAHVAPPALWRILKQYEKLLKSQKKDAEPLEPCTGVFTTTLGLPCSHRLDTLIKLDRVPTIREIHSHWCYIKPKLRRITSVEDADEYMNVNDLELDPEEVDLTNDDGITPEHLRIDEPAVIQGKGRPKGSLNKKKQQAFDNSTRRLPSQFELAEAHAQEHVWSQGGTQASVQVPNSQPATQRGRGQRGGRAQQGGRGQRGGRGSVPGVPSHMTSTIQF